MATSAKKLFKEWQKDPEYRREYEALEEEFSRAKALVAARSVAGLTQAEVAKRMGTTQPVVARLESGKQKPSLATLERYAQAVGCAVRLELVPRGEIHSTAPRRASRAAPPRTTTAAARGKR